MMSAKNRSFHNLEAIPDGQRIGDINPVFSKITTEVRVGKQSTCCTSCRKPFDAVRKARKEIRLYPAQSAAPFAFAYPICGACVTQWRLDGAERDSVMAAVESFHYGEEASQ